MIGTFHFLRIAKPAANLPDSVKESEERRLYMIKYEYETGLCKQLRYNGLWSVQYEGVPGHFQKVKMVCPCIKDGCDRDCEVFRNIPEIKAADQEWHMRDEI